MPRTEGGGGGDFVPVGNGNGGGPRRKKPNKTYREPKPLTGQQKLRQEAKDLVDLEYGREGRQLRRNNQNIRRDYQHTRGQMRVDRNKDLRSSREYGRVADIRTQQIYDALAKSLQGIKKQQSGIYGDAIQGVRGAYNEALGATRGATERGADAISQLARQLGLEAGLPEASQGLVEELARYQAENKGARASSVGNLKSSKADTLANTLQHIGDSRRLEAQNRSDILSRVQEEMANTRQDYRRELGDLRHEAFTEKLENRNQLEDLAQIKGAAFRTALRELTVAKNDRQRQKALDKLAAEIQRGTLDLQRQQLGLQRDQFDFESDLARDQFNLSKAQQRFNNTLALKNDARAEKQFKLQRRQILDALEGENLTATEEALARQQLRKINAEIKRINADTAKKKKETTQIGKPKPGDEDEPTYKRQRGVENYLDDVGATGAQKSLLNSALDYIVGQVVPGGAANEFQDAINILNSDARFQDMKPSTKKWLKDIVHIYYNRYN